MMLCCERPIDDQLEPTIVEGAKEQAIVGGIEVETCGFPTTVSLGGCTGTLIHPQVVLTAEHCGSPRTAEFTSREGRGFTRRINCRAVPQGRGIRDDTMFCILDTPVTEIPITPPLMGCEEEALEVGTDVFIVGFGRINFNNTISAGIKRWQETQIVGFDAGISLIGTPERSACPGDSGGPVFVRLADGGLRVFGNVSGGTTGIPCNGRGAYPTTSQHVPWFESTFDIDITPYHDADGTWNPGPQCGGFYAGNANGNGTWENQCAGSLTSGFSETCGAPFDDENPAQDPPETTPDSCDDVPSQFLDVDDGCDCPADGTESCDPDCEIDNGAGAFCGCDYCYSAQPPPPPPPMCDSVPPQYIGVDDGCDCPADGSESCDPDCELGNGGEAACGCDFCY